MEGRDGGKPIYHPPKAAEKKTSMTAPPQLHQLWGTSLSARGADGKTDLSKFNGVEKHFLEFETQHAKNAQTQMVKVHEMLGHAYIEMGEDAKATTRYNQLKELVGSANDVWLGAARIENGGPFYWQSDNSSFLNSTFGYTNWAPL